MNCLRLSQIAFCLFFILPGAGAATAASSSLHSIAEMPRVEGNIKVDGIANEQLWNSALRIQLNVETQPGENIAAPVATTALLAENGESLLVAFLASDSVPDKNSRLPPRS